MNEEIRMRNAVRWRPSKFSLKRGQLFPSRDRRELAPSSRLLSSLIADFYNRTLPAYASGALLDLGCGKQPLYGKYRERAHLTIAVDWPTSMHASDHIDLYCDISKPLPFRDEQFDTVLSSDVLEHLPDPQLMFREVGRVLRPGGVLLLNTPFLYPVHEAPHDYLRHTRFSLTRLCADAGLEVVVLQPLGGVLDVLVDTIGKLLGGVPRVGMHLAGLLQGVAIRLGNTAVAQNVRALTSGHFPLGHGLVARKAPGRAGTETPTR